MANTKHTNNNEGVGVNPIVAGIAGAAVGAGIAVAATNAMKDEKTRERVKDVFDTVKGKAMDYVESVKETVADEGEMIKAKTKDGTKAASKMVAAAKKD